MTFQRQANYDSINYRDVTHAQFKSSRSTNPLNPEYQVRDEDNKLVTIGEIDAKKKLVPERSLNSLKTDDINGATTNTVMRITQNRTQFRAINKIDDIAGTTVGSLKKGITTLRSNDPLDPDYKQYNPSALDKPGLKTMFDGLGSAYPDKSAPKPRSKPNLTHERKDVKFQKPLNNDQLT